MFSNFKMRGFHASLGLTTCVAGALFALSANANAASVTFASDPFAGTTALTNPGRQVVQNEPSITFSPATDVFTFNQATFGIGSQINFANAPVASLPTSGANVDVLQTLDDDNNPATPFGAGNAATLIANQVTTDGAGFFIYFNSALNLDRLVFSTDLNDPTADLAVLARMTNLTGQTGLNALPTFTAANFATTAAPEPASYLLMGVSGAFLSLASLVRRNQRRNSEVEEARQTTSASV
jgi:hypothetical protein